MIEEPQIKQRLGIAIPLSGLRAAMQDYLKERGGTDDLLPRLLLSDFLTWAQKQQFGNAEDKG